MLRSFRELRWTNREKIGRRGVEEEREVVP